MISIRRRSYLFRCYLCSQLPAIKIASLRVPINGQPQFAQIRLTYSLEQRSANYQSHLFVSRAPHLRLAITSIKVSRQSQTKNPQVVKRTVYKLLLMILRKDPAWFQLSAFTHFAETMFSLANSLRVVNSSPN